MTGYEELIEWYYKKNQIPYDIKNFKTEKKVKDEITNLLNYAKEKATTTKQQEFFEKEKLRVGLVNELLPASIKNNMEYLSQTEQKIGSIGDLEFKEIEEIKIDTGYEPETVTKLNKLKEDKSGSMITLQKLSIGQIKNKKSIRKKVNELIINKAPAELINRAKAKEAEIIGGEEARGRQTVEELRNRINKAESLPELENLEREFEAQKDFIATLPKGIKVSIPSIEKGLETKREMIIKGEKRFEV